MSENISAVPSHHHLDAVGGSTLKLQSGAVDVSGAFSRVVSRPQRSVAGQSFSSRCAPAEDADPLYSQLWHACAGSLVTLPRVGSRVVYFPQGHIEQVAACTNQGVDMQMPHYNLPSQILCRVLNMTLSAERETDEVYAQMTLVPETEQIDLLGDADEEIPSCPKHNLHMFIKPLTASDTSTHGGFSVPRRAAEECLPPLDFQQSPPTQDLIAKDLHGVEWKFRHIYRGHPKRHLLTTGWSVFVSQKRLVAGDAVIFLRGENGELRLGVRRSIRQQSSVTSSSLLSSHSMHLGVLAAAAHAVSTKTMFSIFYNPRTSPAEFVIPYYKYVSALRNNLSIGMRFKMRFETEESSERRYMGTITGVGDFDSSRWPNSKWRCLKVGWDEQIASERQERVSPWEIEPFIAPTVLNLPEPRSTRLRLSNPSPVVDLSLLGVSNTQLDMVPCVQYQRVLQGNHDVRSSGVVVADEDTEGITKSANWKVRPNDCKNEKRTGTESCASQGRSDSKIVNTSGIKMSGVTQDFQVPMQFPAQMLDNKQHQLKLQLQQSNEEDNAMVNTAMSYRSSTTVAKELCEPDLQMSVTPQDMQDSQKRNRQGFLDSQSRSDLTLWWSPDNEPLQSTPHSSIAPDGTMDWLAGMRSSASLPENFSGIGGPETSSTTSHSKVEHIQLGPGQHTEQSCTSWKAYQHQDNEHGPSVTDQNCKIFGFTLISGYMGKHIQLGTLETPDNDERSTEMPHASTSYYSPGQVDYVSKLHAVGKQELDPLESMDQNNTQPRCPKEQDWPQVPLRTRVKVYTSKEQLVELSICQSLRVTMICFVS
ncbi:hypothetical protein O6H91_15G075500 [Diphasiastrum complanatum]|uniref:Uncharacterized protein n=1 Tax=Diphasiastrum complanatum TaxID=34168 RepID=A0ACC2BJS6_DIPCM|nr:hypothetical protein O6H91_15G075500 [Diphasiastrum complanatum]